MKNKKVITTNQSFKDIIEDKKLYIDKTNQIYNLIKTQEHIFFKRPRRFGKSMLISTLFELFSGNKELFKDLHIGTRTTYEFEEFPVIYISFASYNSIIHNDNIQGFLDKYIYISYKGIIYNRNDFEIADNSLGELIKNIFHKFNKKVVLLIDEYDKIATSNFHNPKKQEYVDFLTGLYSGVKEASATPSILKFTFISGLTKILFTDLFSTLNHLNDISNIPDYYDLCGYTKDEILQNFDSFEDDYLSLLSKKYGHTKDEEMNEIKRFYNGYNFGNNNDLIYNPYSINSLFLNQEYGYYWANTGRASLIKNYLTNTSKKEYIKICNRLNGDKAIPFQSEGDILSLDETLDEYGIIKLLYITGYLTRKGMSLVPPNEETRFSILSDFLKLTYEGNEEIISLYRDTGVILMSGILNNDESDIHYAMKRIEGKMKDIVHDWQSGNPEGMFKEKFLELLRYSLSPADYIIHVEKGNDRGDADIVIEIPYIKAVIIIEAKATGTLDSAMEQIECKYLDTYLHKNNFTDIYMIGMKRFRGTANDTQKSELSWSKVKHINKSI